MFDINVDGIKKIFESFKSTSLLCLPFPTVDVAINESIAEKTRFDSVSHLWHQQISKFLICYH